MVTLAHPQRSGLDDAWTRGVEGPRPLSDVRFKTLSCGRVGYARASGPLDVATADSFRQQVQRLLGTGCRALILDLSGVPFVDSEGVRALLGLRDEAASRSAWLRVVVTPGSSVERTLRLLRFDALFSIFCSASAAWRRQWSPDGRPG
jgi:anti-sigma B factor antagonist